MATNPSYQTNTGVTLSGDNPVNNPSPHVRDNRNNFDRSYPHITTARYGDVTPFYVESGVEKDTIPLNSRHEVRTPTMVSPFMGDLQMKKAYFDVPLRAIYRKNYELMKVPPVDGDDIPIRNTAYIPKGFFDGLYSLSVEDSVNWGCNLFIDYLLLLEKFFSRASLFERLGCHLSCCFRYAGIGVEWLKTGDSFDILFEKISSYLFNGVQWETSENRYWLSITDTETNKVFYPFGATIGIATADQFVSLHWLLERLRENPTRFRANITTGSSSLPNSVINEIVTGMRFQVPNDINIERLIAYQLACVEYCTDDHIDNIYSTDLWLNMMTHYFSTIINSHGNMTYFNHNGVNLEYDCFASVIWDEFFFDGISALFSTPILPYIWNLFSIRKSLRFEDYFVGGRLNPLAIGDVNAPVVGGSVNAYEITRSQVYQRFLNSVNISGPEFDSYNKKVLHNQAPPRDDVPKFLSMTRSSIRGYEVENTTSENQGSIVTNVRSDDERFAFDITLDHESIVIGVMMFEARRMYSKTVDRQFYHLDRYDRFIPGLQYLGDQDISCAELRANEPLDEPFAYGVRNGEYKQRVGVVSGGVVDFLKSWTMVTDVVDSYDDDANLNSDYIRSKNVEFDRFFITTNNSDAGWFHFILKLDNISNPIRPMDVAPNVLI